MIRVTSDGKSHDLKVIETESGVDLSRFLRHIKLEWDHEAHRLVAILTIDRVSCDIAALTQYLVKEKTPKED